MTRRSVALSLVALALTLGACVAAGDPGSVAGAIEQKKQAGKTKEIKPPTQPDLERTGRVGLRLSTNSLGWQRALGTRKVDGAVVVFVLPGSPAARAGFVRGDVITRIDSTPIHNDQRGTFGLRGRVGEPLLVTVARPSGTVDIQVTPGPPPNLDITQLVDAGLKAAPNDPTNLLLRAQLTENIKDALGYVNRALETQPDLVDALVYRAQLYWVESLQVGNEAVVLEDRRRAIEDYRRALDVDPRATTALRARGAGLLQIRQFDDAERDGLRAIGIDETLPEAYYLVALARLGIGRARDAAAPARDAVRLDPYDPDRYRVLALTFVALNRRADAEETVRVGLTVATDENQRAALRAVVEG